eukprot:4290737-Pleurochrysis_carterae.AAC.4
MQRARWLKNGPRAIYTLTRFSRLQSFFPLEPDGFHKVRQIVEKVRKIPLVKSRVNREAVHPCTALCSSLSARSRQFASRLRMLYAPPIQMVRATRSAAHSACGSTSCSTVRESKSTSVPPTGWMSTSAVAVSPVSSLHSAPMYRMSEPGRPRSFEVAHTLVIGSEDTGAFEQPLGIADSSTLGASDEGEESAAATDRR